MSGRMRSKVIITCEYCGKTATVTRKGKNTARFCNRSCAAKATNARPDVKAAIAAALSKPITKACEWCGLPFTFRSKGKKNEERRFCGSSCAAKWRCTLPGRQKIMARMQRNSAIAKRGTKDPKSAERMRRNNPMHSPETREKVGAALRGRPFPAARGGNGQPTKPQMMLADATGFAMEHPISTKGLKGQFGAVPSCYKVDLAHVSSRTAIEVDGYSHKTMKGRVRDQQKDAVLSALGWSVLRFSNQRVLEDLEGVTAEIRMSIASK